MKTIIALIISCYATLSFAVETFIPTPNRTVLYNGPIDFHAIQIANSIVQTVIMGDRTKPLDIIISSQGGSVRDGYNLIGAIDFAKGAGINVRCLNIGSVQSMGFMIFMHCKQRFSLQEATFLFHYPAITAPNPADRLDQDTLLSYAAHLKGLEEQFVTDLEYHLHADETSIREHCKAETEWTVDQINEYSPGFVTVVTGIQGVTLKSLFQ